MQFHVVGEDIPLPFLAKFPLVECIDMTLPVIMDELVVADDLIYFYAIGLREADHEERHQLLARVTIVFHAKGVGRREAKVGSCTPVESVGVMVTLGSCSSEVPEMRAPMPPSFCRNCERVPLMVTASSCFPRECCLGAVFLASPGCCLVHSLH